ncbi:Ead/Ea22-like family protein [Escherichia coli]
MSNIDKQAQGEKTREAFERWAEQSGALPWGILKKHRNQDGTYPGPHYTYMWHAWNACHEALLDELEAKDAQIANLTAERDALREGEMGDAKHSNTRAAADIYFQLVEECEIPAGGSLVEYISDLRERAAAGKGE